MKFMEKIKEFKLLATTISMLIVFIISGYTTYQDIYKTIDKNQKQLELTQKSILNSQINMLEANPCKTSRTDWADYNMLLSQHHMLQKKHNPMLDSMTIKPMERLNKDSCKCYKGDCNE